jgi:hypothetical protein
MVVADDDDNRSEFNTGIYAGNAGGIDDTRERRGQRVWQRPKIQQPTLWPNAFLAEWRRGDFTITTTTKSTMTTTTARTMTITQQPISWSDAFLAEGGEGKK